MRVPLASSGLREADLLAAEKTLRSGQLTMGSRVREFEESIARYLGFKHFVMTNSGSSANLAIVEALMRPSKANPTLTPGDAVLVPAIAWPTTIWPIIQLGLRPMFVDVDRSTMGFSLEAAEKVIVENPQIKFKAMFPIHPLGYALPSGELMEFADKHGLTLLSDVCESLGAFEESTSKHAGHGSKAISVSFYFSHHITCMEGGGVATNDDVMFDDLLSVRSHGWSRSRRDSQSWLEEVEPVQRPFLFVTSGFNIRPMEVQASIGQSQLEDIDEFTLRRREIARTVAQGLSNARNIEMKFARQALEMSTGNSWMHLTLAVTGSRNNRERRNHAVQLLEKMNVETRPLLTGNFLRQPAAIRLGIASKSAVSFSNAETLANESFLVGCHPDLDNSQISYLIETLLEVDSLVG